MNTAKFLDKNGNTVGHVIRPEDRHRIKCDGTDCNERAALAHYGLQDGHVPPFWYRCLEHSPLPDLFASGEISVQLERAGTNTLYIARFIPTPNRYIGPAIEFRTAKTGRLYKAYKYTRTEAENYVWEIAQMP